MKFSSDYEYIKLPKQSKAAAHSWNDAKDIGAEGVRKCLRAGLNYGVRLKQHQLVIDIDPRNGGKRELFGFDLTDYPTVLTPSGGWHIYMLLPPGVEIYKNRDQFPGVDFKSIGGYVVGPGSVHPDFPEGPKYQWDDFSTLTFPPKQCPPELLAIIARSHTSYDELEGLIETDLWTPEQVKESLGKLNVEDFGDNETWFALMIAVHEASGGLAKQEFLEWSTSDPKYSEHEKIIGKRWDSLRAGKAGNAGAGTLLHILLEHGVEGPLNIDLTAEFADVVKDNPNPQTPDLPLVIRIKGGFLPQQVRAIEEALGKRSKSEPFNGTFQRAALLVRIARYAGTIDEPDEDGISRANGTLQILNSGTDMLRMRMTECAEWLKYDARSEEWKRVDAPHEVANTLQEASGLWPNIPVLNGILEAPTMRPDGTVLSESGYDAQSGLFLDTKLKFATVKDAPTFEDAEAALALLSDLVKGFPFVNEEGRSTALAMMLTPFARFAMRSAPMFVISAPKMGSGKTLLSNLPNYIASGKPSSLISQSDTPEEERKRLLALLLQGSMVTVIDNVERPLKSDALCTALTEPTIQDRILGSTRVISVPTRTVWIVTGNNVRVDGDLTSRCLLIALDPECERPEERSFDVNLHEFAPRNRNVLASAALTILRAYVVAGSPLNKKTPVYGRFEQWSKLIREPLMWLGMKDPCETRKAIETRDPVRDNLGNLLCAWWAKFGNQALTVQEVVQEVDADLDGSFNELSNAINAVAQERGRINNHRLGNFISRHESRIEQGCRFEKYSNAIRSTVRWRVNNLDDLGL
jgi:hypothetical protein